MSKRNYKNKAPFSTLHPNPEHWTRKGNSFKQKVAYETEDDAWEFLNQNPRLKDIGFTCYQCKICSMWHVGKLKNKRSNE